MFPRAQLFEAHSFGHPKFSVPTQAVQTLSPLTFPQWQGPGGQTIAALHSAHSWVASGRTTACFVCWFWRPIRETPQSLHGECRTPCQDHYASLQWPWIAAHYSTEDLRDVQFTQGYNVRHRYQHWWTELIPDMVSPCCVFESLSDQQQNKTKQNLIIKKMCPTFLNTGDMKTKFLDTISALSLNKYQSKKPRNYSTNTGC